MTRLHDATLNTLPAHIKRPAYDRATIKTGIVHLGVGAFHRAHQAVYTDAILASDPRWGIFGVSLRSPDTYNALHPQNGLYTLAIGDGDATKYQVIGALKNQCVAPHDFMRAPHAIAAPDVHLVTLTVSEKGYSLNPATRVLREDDTDIVHDIQNPNTPRTTIGTLVAGLRLRFEAGLPALSIVPCDNLPNNGAILRALVLRFAELQDKTLAHYIEDNIHFPSSMVDRIVPATTEADRAQVAGALGLDDAWPVMSEPFTQFVIEDKFGRTPRPPWEEAGVLFVQDVAPYEMMKLRLLNASHSSIAYLGSFMGFETVADAIAMPELRSFIADMMRLECAPSLPLMLGFDVRAYQHDLLTRFANRALKHRTLQIAMDGSQKLPQRHLTTVRVSLAKGLPFDRLALSIAAFLRYMSGVDEQHKPIIVQDPLAETFAKLVEIHGATSPTLVTAMLNVEAIFGLDLPRNPRFITAVSEAYNSLLNYGARQTLLSLQARLTS